MRRERRPAKGLERLAGKGRIEVEYSLPSVLAMVGEFARWISSLRI